MGFVKIGDDMPVTNYIDDDGIVICPECDGPIVTVAIDEDNNIKTACKCQNPDIEDIE